MNISRIVRQLLFFFFLKHLSRAARTVVDLSVKQNGLYQGVFFRDVGSSHLALWLLGGWSGNIYTS